MKRPYEYIMHTFLQSLDRQQENQQYNFEKADKLIIWIVGFSVGGLSIIVTNLTEFSTHFHYITSKIILTLLTISIVCGVINRWSDYVYQVYHQNVEFYLRGAFTSDKIMRITPIDLTNIQDVQQIAASLKRDYDDDVSHIFPQYYKLDNKTQLATIKSLKDRYYTLARMAKDEHSKGIQLVKETYQEAYGLSEKELGKLFEPNSSKHLRLFGNLTRATFIICSLSFLLVMIILCIKF